MIRDAGMQCTLFQPFRDLEGMPPEQRARAFERMERKFDVMAELGTDLILLCSNCSHSPSTIERGRDDLSSSASAPRSAGCESATRLSRLGPPPSITATRGT